MAMRRWRSATTRRGGWAGCRSTRCGMWTGSARCCCRACCCCGQLLTIGRVVFMFGWAKPVPVSAWRFRNPRRGMAMVAAAGPAMNFFLAWLGALALHVTGLLPEHAGRDRRPDARAVRAGQPGAGPVQPAAAAAARWRAHRGRHPAGAAGRRPGRGWSGPGIVLVLLLVFLLPRLLAEMGIRFDPVGRALNRIVPWATRSRLPAGGLAWS